MKSAAPFALVLGPMLFGLACSAGGGGDVNPKSAAGGSGVDAAPQPTDDGGTPVDTGTIIFDASISDAAPTEYVDPTTCWEAEQYRSYIGCDYWPTVTANSVWNVFDFAVAVSNTGKSPADVTVSGNGVDVKETVPPNELKLIYLPWVHELKGPEFDTCTAADPMSVSVLAKNSAYHLVSSVPVTVYQFNALQYKGEGGPSGKNWSSCPGNEMCPSQFGAVGCFSFSNDASLLLPSTAMTGNYRMAGAPVYGDASFFISPYAVITAVHPGTKVRVRPSVNTMPGTNVPAISAGQEAVIDLEQGDVLELLATNSGTRDLSGSLILADKPVQVISGMQGRVFPDDAPAMDHLEESVFPAETLGRSYIVTVPASPNGNGSTPAPGQVVRIVGNEDGTTLNFDPPIKADGVVNGQATIQAGGVLDLGLQADNFKVWSEDKSFIVAVFQIGGTLVDPPDPLFGGGGKGDPSQSFVPAIEQSRTSYVFLAPNDYDINFVNIVGRPDSAVVLDGNPVPPEWYIMIGNTGYGVVRFMLDRSGTHKLTSQQPVGIQVYGYGEYTSYQYPGGLNLKTIAAPPK